ncbi:MAG: ABC transporter permease [Thermoplasmata archaeon]|nr:ABC transporter permease [Thermoplasmata archaeon]
MIEEIKKIGIFIKRDFKILFTYRLAFSAMFLNMLFNLFYFILFGSMFGEKMPDALLPYKQDFVTYLLLGSIGWSFLWSVMSSSSIALRNEMMMGTLESILLSSTKITTIIISYTIFGCFMGLLSTVIFLAVGYFVYHVHLAANIFTFIIFALSILMMSGIGMLFSGLTIWVKNIGQTIPLIQNITMFFSGVYFPVSVLPSYLQKIATFIPFYYSIEGMRISIVSPEKSMEYIVILSFLVVIFIIIGLYALNKGMEKAMKEGSLAFY